LINQSIDHSAYKKANFYKVGKTTFGQPRLT